MISSIGVIGAEIGWGQNKPGVEMAPTYFRSKGFLNDLKERKYDVTDYGNITTPHAQMKPHFSAGALFDHPDFGKVYERLAHAVRNVTQENDFAITIGGDHSMALGSIYGLLEVHPQMGIIWVDAHGDINTPESSLTGHFHGMPVAGLLGCLRNFSGFSWIESTMNASQFVYVGLRDLDPPEEKLIGQLGIRAFTMQDVRELGMRKVIQEAVRWLSHNGPCPLHLSFDIDSVDPIYAPSTGVPVHNGLSIFDVQVLSQYLHTTERLISMDIVEMNPLLAKSHSELASTWSVIQTLVDGVLPSDSQRFLRSNDQRIASRPYRLQDKTIKTLRPSSSSPVTS
jgi:arginase